MNELQILNQRIAKLEQIINAFIRSDRYIFQKHLQMFDANNISVGGNKGTKIGTATTQKLAFYGVTPVVQAGAISAPSGGATVDAEARTAINSIRTALKNFGVIG